MPGGGNVSPVPSPTRVRGPATQAGARSGAGHREVGPTLPGGRPGSRGAVAPPARGEGGNKEMNLSPAMSLVGRVSYILMNIIIIRCKYILLRLLYFWYQHLLKPFKPSRITFMLYKYIVHDLTLINLINFTGFFENVLFNIVWIHFVKVLQEQGLGRHIDEDFIAAAAVEMQEAMNMTAEEFNAAAEQLLLAETTGEFR